VIIAGLGFGSVTPEDCKNNIQPTENTRNRPRSQINTRTNCK